MMNAAPAPDALGTALRRSAVANQQASVAGALSIDAGVAAGPSLQRFEHLRLWKGDGHFPSRLAAAAQRLSQLVRRYPSLG